MLIRAGIIVLAGTLFGRLLGFIREVQIAAAFGAGQVAEAAIITFILPDLLMNIFLGGSLSYVLIPKFVGLPRANSWRLHIQMSLLAGLVFGFIALVVGLFSPNILVIFNQHFPVELAKQAQHAIALSAWLMPLIALAGVTTAYLQANNRFLTSAFSTSIYNGILVVSLSWFIIHGLGSVALLVLAVTMIVGGLLRSAVLWWDSLKFRTADGPEDARRWLIHSSLLKSYLFALAGGASLMMLPLIGRIYAGQYGEGALAQFNYASKLIELPLGVAITVIATVALPALSQSFAADRSLDVPQNAGRWQSLLMQNLRISILVSLVIMLPCIWFAPDLTYIAFDWGKMDADSLAGIESLLGVGFLLLLVQGIISITSAALASAGSTSILAWSGLVGMLAFLAGAALSNRYGQLNMLMVAMVTAYGAVMVWQGVSLSFRHNVNWSVFLFAKYLWQPVAAVLATFTVLAGIYSRFETNHWQGLALAALSMALMSSAVLAASPEIRRVIFSKRVK